MLNTAKHCVIFSFVGICVIITVRKCYALYVFTVQSRYIIQHDN